MNYDRAIAYDPNDNTIYVVDTDNQSIKKYNLSGTFICDVGVFGTGLGQFNEPQGISVAPNGTVYVADSLNQRVQVFSPNSCTPTSTFGSKGTGPGQFEFLRTVTYDPTDGSLWTADQILGEVEHFSGTGQYLGSFGSSGTGTNQFSQPSDIVLDGNYVLVSDTATHQIKIWTKQGVFLKAYGGFGTALGKFEGPYGMAFAPNGNLYVMEQQNDRIQILSVTLSS
jgi:DNA-binding beta-propeller fold protein YncE